jgi:hypothetical protein
MKFTKCLIALEEQVSEVIIINLYLQFKKSFNFLFLGILALGSVATINGGLSPVADSNEIIKIFEDHGTSIFNSSKLSALLKNFINNSKYDPTGIYNLF